jgi:hypothetical protein
MENAWQAQIQGQAAPEMPEIEFFNGTYYLTTF